jgi:glyoxylase-like metal-dependent hydrolase (beta-lactamase superfamily II)
MEPNGIHGKALYTPGHTSGSMIILLDSGEASVGDKAVGGLPQCLSPYTSIFLEDANQVKASWRLLLEQGAKWIYPAHGKPFKADVLARKL